MSTRKMRRGAFALTAIPALVLAIGGTAVALDSNQTQTGSQDNSATQSAIGGNATATQGVAANENTPVITGSAGSTVTNAQSNSVMADASASNSNDATQLLGQSAQSVGGSSTSGASCDQSQVASQTNQATQTATGGTATATQVTATNTNTPAVDTSAGSTVDNTQSNAVMADASAANDNTAQQGTIQLAECIMPAPAGSSGGRRRSLLHHPHTARPPRHRRVTGSGTARPRLPPAVPPRRLRLPLAAPGRRLRLPPVALHGARLRLPLAAPGRRLRLPPGLPRRHRLRPAQAQAVPLAPARCRASG